MKTHKKTPVVDFFARYHRDKIIHALPSVFVAFVFSFFVVASWNGGVDTRMMMASVAQVAAQKYDADIVLVRSGDGVDIVFGGQATHVDEVRFTLLGDPEKIQSIKSSDAIIEQGEPGMYVFSRKYESTSLMPGARLAHIVLE